MGCSSVRASYKDQLDAIEASVAAATGPSREDSLDAMEFCAARLREVMGQIVAAGAKDVASLRRLEALSEPVLGALDRRVTVDLLQRSDAESLLGQLLRIARDLDSVRAAKASTVIEGTVSRRRDELQAAEEAKAKAPLAQLRQLLDQVKDAASLMPGATMALDIIETTHVQMPLSKRVTELLLKGAVELATKVMKFKAAWVTHPAKAITVKMFAARLDATAWRLVAVLGASWDPPMTPQIERLVQAHAVKVCTEVLANVEKEIGNGSRGAAFDQLEALKSFWPALIFVGAASLQVVCVFSEIETLATQDFLKATEAGDAALATEICLFAQKLDKLRTAFEGLPPSSGGPLAESLVRGEAKAAAERQLNILVSELAQAGDDDRATNLSLGAMVQALEALASVWPVVVEPEGLLAERMQATCGSLEDWAEGAAAIGGPGRVDILLRFAEEYDARRNKLAPPVLGKGALRPRIATHAAAAHLKQVEAELASGETLNSNSVLDGLRAAAAVEPASNARDALRDLLGTAVAAAEERVSRSFREALLAGEVRKEELLVEFAEGSDEALLAPGAGLSKRLQEERTSLLEEYLHSAEGELAKPDLPALLQTFRALQPWWPRLLARPEHRERLVCALALLPQLLDQACASSSVEALHELLRLASDMDEAMAGLAPEVVAPPLRARVVCPSLRAHLEVLTATLQGPAVQEAQLLQELAQLKPLFAEAAYPAELCERMRDLVGGPLRQVLLGKLLAGSSSDAALLELAIAADGMCLEPAEGGGRSSERTAEGLCKQLEEAQLAAAKLAKVQGELAKQGMEPRLVLKALRELEPLWPQVCMVESFCQCLADALGRYRAKLGEACSEAFASGGDVPKKLQALVALAGEADKLQAALAKAAPDLETHSFRASLARSVADFGLGAAETELLKGSGLNSEAVLRGVEQATQVWELASVADASVKVRLGDLLSKVHMRMEESMLEAVRAGNQRKQQELLKVANDFDAACTGFAEVACAASLTASLEAKRAIATRSKTRLVTISL